MTFRLRMDAVGVWAAGLGLTVWLGCRPDAQVGGTAPERVVQVVVADAKIQEVKENLALVGTLVADEQVEIKSEIDGTVQAIHFAEGEPVESGQLLVELDASKLNAAVEEAAANSKLSAANFERAQSLIRDKLISQQEYDQIVAAYQANEASLALKTRQLKDTRIYAPFAGVIGTRLVSPGQVISRNTTLSWLVDLDPVKVEIQAPERFLGQLQVGQFVDVTVAAFPEEKFQGEVFFIAPYVDPNLRTSLIKARIPNPKGILFPGMFANIELTLKVRDRSVVVPEEAISKLLDEGYAIMYVMDQAGTAQMVRVKLGLRLPGAAEVLEGLQGGEKVIVQGLQKLAPGLKVRVDDSPRAAPAARPSEGGSPPAPGSPSPAKTSPSAPAQE